MITIGNIEFPVTPVIAAPMEDITDSPYRRICKSYGADLMFTEFISSEGLIRDAEKSLHKLDYTEEERPIGIQIFGHDIQSMVDSALVAEEKKPDLIDLNYGCPVKKVISKGGGAALLQDVPKMIAMTAAVVQAVKIPVTVKTRLGWDYNQKNIVEIAEGLQDAGIAAITIHGRTRAQMYKGTADWTLIGEVKKNTRMHIPVIGNGDITNPEIAKEMLNNYGVDGLMVGRALTGRPWLLSQIKEFLETGNYKEDPDTTERIATCRKQLSLSVAEKGEQRALKEMRKFYSNYFKGYHGFKPYKLRLMEAVEMSEVEGIFEEILQTYGD